MSQKDVHIHSRRTIMQRSVRTAVIYLEIFIPAAGAEGEAGSPPHSRVYLYFRDYTRAGIASFNGTTQPQSSLAGSIYKIATRSTRAFLQREKKREREIEEDGKRREEADDDNNAISDAPFF